ncbi:unnamed protein product [Mytilus coruscus]|uniref:Uncharacterized protein n=1 Tax=Mytilus coruscus TaxID=42192 RepID=A0A6J8DGH4_MYTCO|nr:unnamed protein product [Mytilus coruscus]
MWLFGAIFVCLHFMMVHTKSCDEVYTCPNATFNADESIDYEYDEEHSKWKMTLHLNFFDVVCPYLSEMLTCIKNYGAICDDKQQHMFRMMENTYNPVCITHKAELTGLISSCFNDEVYQEQLMECHNNADQEYIQKENNRSPSRANKDSVDCGIVDGWASCIHDVIKACSPENAHVFLPIVEAAKPGICIM